MWHTSDVGTCGVAADSSARIPLTDNRIKAHKPRTCGTETAIIHFQSLWSAISNSMNDSLPCMIAPSICLIVAASMLGPCANGSVIKARSDSRLLFSASTDSAFGKPAFCEAISIEWIEFEKRCKQRAILFLASAETGWAVEHSASMIAESEPR